MAGKFYLKKCLSAFLISGLVFWAFTSANAADYCASNGRSVSYEWIDAVTVNSDTNVTGSNGGYADFTAQVIDLEFGPNPIDLTPGFGYGSYDEYWRIWIDLDQNGAFDADELVFENHSRTGLSGEIVIPEDALAGETRMRVSMKWAGYPPGCGTFSYGEVEDYTVRLAGETAALGKISDMVAGSDPEFVYALDEDNQALYRISTITQQIVETVQLLDSQPVAMAYSAPDNRLYIVSRQSGDITVYDLATGTLLQVNFSETRYGSDIAVAPTSQMRRIYVLSPNGSDSYLTALDMDTGDVTLETSVGGSSIVYGEVVNPENSEAGQPSIFTANSGLSPSTIFKYSVTVSEQGDTVALVQNIQSGGNGRKINISPNGDRIVFPCGGGNGQGYTLYDYSSADLNVVQGEWDIGTYPKAAAFSPDNSILFGINGSPYDKYLYVMDANTYQQIRKLDFPNADDVAVFTPNSDGTVVVGFSYDSYANDEYQLYFFEDVLPEAPVEVELGKISDMVAGSDPENVYAVDEDNAVLYRISTTTQQITETILLPDAQPMAMDYSAMDQKLYIVSKFSGELTVYDINSKEFSQTFFSSTKFGRDIAVAPAYSRIYILSPNGYNSYLTVLNMDTGETVLESSVGGSSIVFGNVAELENPDISEPTIFTANSGLSPATIYKYSVANDDLVEVQNFRTGGNGRKINISPDSHHVVLPCGGGNGAGYTIYDFDPTDLNNYYGEWDVGTYPKFADFSPDGQIFFGTNGNPYDNFLYVMDANTYQPIRKLAFPNADDYVVFTPNSDGSAVVGFSYDTYYDSDYSLFFFTNVGQ